MAHRTWQKPEATLMGFSFRVFSCLFHFFGCSPDDMCKKKLVKQEHVTSQSCNRKFLAGI